MNSFCKQTERLKLESSKELSFKSATKLTRSDDESEPAQASSFLFLLMLLIVLVLLVVLFNNIPYLSETACCKCFISVSVIMCDLTWIKRVLKKVTNVAWFGKTKIRLSPRKWRATRTRDVRGVRYERVKCVDLNDTMEDMFESSGDEIVAMFNEGNTLRLSELTPVSIRENFGHADRIGTNNGQGTDDDELINA